MNSGLAHTIDSLFGPASEKVDVKAFIESEGILCQDTLPAQSSSSAVADECSVSDIRDSLYDLWNNPTLSAALLKDHERTIAALHAVVNPRKSRKTYPTIDSPLPEVSNLQKNIESVSLTAWRLHVEAVTFMRSPKNSDHNILEQVKTTPGQSTAIDTPQAVLTVSIHNRVSWGPSYVNRSSQHVFLSSQNLQDLCATIPCISNHLPPEAGFESENLADNGEAQSVICIEGLLYGNHINEGYADKLMNQIEILKKKPSFSISKASTSLQQTTFSSLSLRLNEPYWLIHKGNCEHFIVFDQIRLFHPSDAKFGYPLTLQITPSPFDLCRACSKVPAVWSIVGDVRLGENPCVLCDFCWKHMGESREEGVVALPLPNPALALI